MSNFDPNAIIRGAQLTFVGAHRALQNPNVFRNEIYRQAALAVALGVIIQLIVSAPVGLTKIILWIIDCFTDLDAYTWDDKIVDALHFVQHSVLQLPFFLMSLMRFVTPAMDHLFMDSLQWVDQTYVAKHKSDDPDKLRAMYYPHLRLYPGKASVAANKTPKETLIHFLIRYGRKAGFSLTVLLLSYTPYIGKLVLPALSFYYFNTAVGPRPAVVIFASGLVLPRRYVVIFLQTYFSSRSMMRELLVPYFNRVRFTPKQKQLWLLDRTGVLFGFGIAFFLLIKIPLVGVFFYGIAEASTAYLITKITDPPPPLEESQSFIESQVRWTNKNKFLSLDLADIDANNVKTPSSLQNPLTTTAPRKQFS